MNKQQKKWSYDEKEDVYVMAGAYGGDIPTAFFNGIVVCQLKDGQFEMYKSSKIPVSRGLICTIKVKDKAQWQEADKYAFASYDEFTKSIVQDKLYVQIAQKLVATYCKNSRE